VQSQIEKICGQIAGTLEAGDEVGPPEVDEDDLSLEKLEDFRAQLQELQKEKVSL
jgi:Ase1/PRC1/MAP65 family protein